MKKVVKPLNTVYKQNDRVTITVTNKPVYADEALLGYDPVVQVEVKLAYKAGQPFEFKDEDMNVAKMAEEPEHYRTERAARHAHELIEEMSRPKERKPPVEVQQAHRTGSLESDVKHMEREAYTQARRAEQAETEANQLRAERDILARDLRDVKKDRDEWKESSLKHQQLHKDLLAKRRRRY